MLKLQPQNFSLPAIQAYSCQHQDHRQSKPMNLQTPEEEAHLNVGLSTSKHWEQKANAKIIY